MSNQANLHACADPQGCRADGNPQDCQWCNDIAGEPGMIVDRQPSSDAPGLDDAIERAHEALEREQQLPTPDATGDDPPDRFELGYQAASQDVCAMLLRLATDAMSEPLPPSKKIQERLRLMAADRHALARAIEKGAHRACS